MRKEKIRGQFGDLFAMYLLNTGLHFDRGQGGGGRGGWGDAEVELEISLFDYFMNIL